MGIQEVDLPSEDITSTGAIAEATLQPAGRCYLTTIWEDGGGSIDVDIEVRSKGGAWRTLTTITGTSAQDTRELSAYEVRLNITSASTSGTADFYFAAGD